MPLPFRLAVMAWVVGVALPDVLLALPAHLVCAGHWDTTTTTQKNATAERNDGVWGWVEHSLPLHCSLHPPEAVDAPPPPPYMGWFRPWHLPLVGALQALALHAPSFCVPPGPRRSAIVHAGQALHVLEHLCYLALLQSALLMGLWAVARVGSSTLWVMAAHGAAQYAWDVHLTLARFPHGTAAPWWLRACLVGYAFGQVPSLFHRAGWLLLHPPLLMGPEGHMSTAHLGGIIFTELCGLLQGALFAPAP
jgi:hypothetical protein